MLRDSNFTFGNQREFTKLAQVLQLKSGSGPNSRLFCKEGGAEGSLGGEASLWTSAGELALSVLDFSCVEEKAADSKKPKVVVMTRGSQSVVVASRE